MAKDKILGRDESHANVTASVERIGVAADGKTRRLQLTAYAEILTLPIEAGEEPDDVILAKPGDMVTLTVTRKFAVLVPSNFRNISLRGLV